MITMPKLADLQNKSFDPFIIEKQATGDMDDPYPRIHELSQRGSVVPGSYRDEFSIVPDHRIDHLPQVMVFGYDTILKVLTAPETFGNYGAFRHTLGKAFGRTVSVMDPPEHGHFRKIFQKAFLPNVVTKWGESIVDPVVDRLMGVFLDRGEADLVEEFTHHYPFQVIYSQLQIGEEQAPIFHKLAIAQVLSSVGAPEADEATAKLGAFFKELLTDRRANPGEDLVSHLATVEADGAGLPDEVLISFLRQLMNAGGDTTYRGTSVLLTGLLTHPEQWAAVEADRSLIAQSIDEALRWEGPVNTTLRYVRHDTVLDGVPLAEGTIVHVVLASANRDPSKFPDPDRFDIFRDRKVRQLAFASGPHVCIGQHLARVEMTRALNALLDRTRNMRLDPAKAPPQIRGHVLRVPDHIHVRFEKA